MSQRIARAVRYVTIPLAAALLLGQLVGEWRAGREESAYSQPGATSAKSAEPIPVIIDTDPAIGYPFGDVDDGIALLMALMMPELRVLGVTVTLGNTSQERGYRRARELLEIAGRTDIPVLRGAEEPGRLNDGSEAVRFIEEASREFDGELVILALGSLTNVASALHHDPELSGRLREVISLGGILLEAEEEVPRRPFDVNYGTDPLAAARTIRSAVPLTMITVNLARRFVLEAPRYLEMISPEAPYGSYLADSTRAWFMLHMGSFVLWDVVALAYLAHPHWFQGEEMSLALHEIHDRRGRVAVRPSPGAERPIYVPESVLDQTLFWHWFDTTLCAPVD